MTMPGENKWGWSTTAFNNGTIDPLIDWHEGQTRASVNNSARSMMAADAKELALRTGQIITGGAANAQTFSSGMGFAATDTIPTGFRTTLKIGAGLTNTGPTTLAMDAIAPIVVKTQAGNDLDPGAFSAGSYPDLIYNGTNWIHQNPRETNLGGATTIHRTVFTAGSGTYTTPTGCLAIDVEMVGGGGGGGPSQVGTGGPGGTTTFGSYWASGGGGGGANGSMGAPGGTTSGNGDVNIDGGAGNTAGSNPVTQVTGGNGGSSYFGGAGTGGEPGVATTPPDARPNSGSGGGGGTSTQFYAGAGGGSGGYLRKLIVGPAATYAYAVGALGPRGVGPDSLGGNGGSGIIIITEYLVPLLTVGGGTSSITINSTLISGGTSGNFLYDNAGKVGEQTPTQVTAALGVFSNTLKGLAPSSGGGTANYLRADGTWAAPPTGGAASSIGIGSTAITGGTSGRFLYDNAGIFGEQTGTQVTAALDLFTSGLKGLAPASGGGTTNFLRADGTWAAPAASPTLPTVTVLSSGSGTYTTPANCKRIEIRMVGGGAGGNGSAGGNAGSASIFGGLTASGGGTGPNNGGAATGGNVLNIVGGGGSDGAASVLNTISGVGGRGGSTPLGDGGSGVYNANGGNGTGYGSGGAGGGINGSIATSAAGAGGSAGGYIEHFINTPAATYSYAVGVGGAGGALGGFVYQGGFGANGIIIVKEFY